MRPSKEIFEKREQGLLTVDEVKELSDRETTEMLRAVREGNPDAIRENQLLEEAMERKFGNTQRK
jgi:hypothetical protein